MPVFFKLSHYNIDMTFSMSNNIAELNMLISSVGLTQEPTFDIIMYNNINNVSTALVNIAESKDREIKI